VIPISNNYYHWLFDELPFTLCVSNRDTNKLVNFVNYGPLKKYQTDMNDYLGITSHEVDKWIKPDQILIPNQRHISGYPTFESLELLRRNILKEVDSSLNQVGHIYVSRKRSSRSLPNENYFEELLLKKGFEILFLEDLDFRTQVSYFQNAKVIVGPHGAGLANLVWANPGTKVFELMTDDYFNSCYSYLASKLELEYHLVKYSDSYDVFKNL
jgi:capsular polysaccharide biosynthesis protein